MINVLLYQLLLKSTGATPPPPPPSLRDHIVGAVGIIIKFFSIDTRCAEHV